MSKPYDATLKTLIDSHAADWVAFLAPVLREPVGPVTLLDTDLSETLQADRVLRVTAAGRSYLLHVELESSHETGRPERMLRYSVAARARAELPVRCVSVLLRPEANSSDLTELLDWEDVTFRYRVVRVWERSAAELLAAGPGMAPLAILTDEAVANPEAVFPRVAECLRSGGLPRAVVDEVVGAAFVIGGLRYDAETLAELYRRTAMNLEDSKTYHWILGRGVLLHARRTVLRHGTRRFGPPPPEVIDRLDAITDAARLDRLTDGVPDAVSWDDLLARD